MREAVSSEVPSLEVQPWTLAVSYLLGLSLQNLCFGPFSRMVFLRLYTSFEIPRGSPDTGYVLAAPSFQVRAES